MFSVPPEVWPIHHLAHRLWRGAEARRLVSEASEATTKGLS